jgi:hypothetical protein
MMAIRQSRQARLSTLAALVELAVGQEPCSFLELPEMLPLMTVKLIASSGVSAPLMVLLRGDV